MQDKRRDKRLPVQLELVVSKMYHQEAMTNLDVNEPIQVIDVSKMGIGFVTTSEFPLNYYFDAKLELGAKENTLQCVVRIVRKKPQEDGTILYGCEFVGLASVLDGVFEEYERILAEEN